MQTYNIIYNFDKNREIVGFFTVLAILTYDIVYDIIRYNTVISTFFTKSYMIYHGISVLYYGQYRMVCLYYTILYVYIYQKVRIYRTTLHAISRPTMWRMISLTWGCVRCGHACGTSVGRPQVLSHDHLPCQMVCTELLQSWRPFPQSGMCGCQCEWWQPCTSKNRNFKVWPCGIAGDLAASWGQRTEW